jgi:hypothetical protein
MPTFGYVIAALVIGWGWWLLYKRLGTVAQNQAALGRALAALCENQTAITHIIDAHRRGRDVTIKEVPLDPWTPPIESAPEPTDPEVNP